MRNPNTSIAIATATDDDGFVVVSYGKHGKTKKTPTPNQHHQTQQSEQTSELESPFTTPFHSITSSFYPSGSSTPCPPATLEEQEEEEEEKFYDIPSLTEHVYEHAHEVLSEQPQQQQQQTLSLRNLMQNHQNYTTIKGLSNNGNFCFLNATIQVLLACQPFHRLLSSTPETPETPLIDSFKSLINEIPKNHQINTPHSLISYLQSNHRASAFLGVSQEDAQEFLTFILDSLHEEFIKLGISISCNRLTTPTTAPTPTSSMPSCDGDWMVSGGNGNGGNGTSKRKVMEQRTLEAVESPISQLFFGEIKSTVRRRGVGGGGQKDSCTIEPFHCLSLPIKDFNTGRSLSTLEASLALFQGKESLGPTIQREIRISKLPPLLLIHLKRMVYCTSGGGIKKITDAIGIPEMMELVPDGGDQRHIYRLRAIIYHLGRTAHGGHYTAHIRNGLGASSTWTYADDCNVREDPCILKGLSCRSTTTTTTNNNKSPYILFYQRQKIRTINK